MNSLVFGSYGKGAEPQITLSVYSAWLSRRSESRAGARLEAFLTREKNGCEMAAKSSPEAVTAA